jgi:hypothetical protein
MSSVAVLGVVWALVGVPLMVRLAQERRALPMEQFQRAMGALQGPLPTPNGPVGANVDAAARRRLVSTLTYAPGLALLGVGIAMSDSSVIAVSLALVNLGTAHRLIGLAVDHSRRPVGLAALGNITHRMNDHHGNGHHGNGNGTGRSGNGSHPVDPGVDETTGDAQTWGDGWKIIGPEPRRMDDLVLVDADLS